MSASTRPQLQLPTRRSLCLVALVLGVTLLHGLGLWGWTGSRGHLPPLGVPMFEARLLNALPKPQAESRRQVQSPPGAAHEPLAPAQPTATVGQRAAPSTVAVAAKSASAASTVSEVAATEQAAAATPSPTGQPPKAGASLVPQSVDLVYRATRGPAEGEARVRWVQIDGHYELTLQVLGDGLPRIDWFSQGEMTEDGLAPTRMEERLKGRAVRAINFQRDKQLLSFSGNARTYPLPPTTQDRASWMVQAWGWVNALPPDTAVGRAVVVPVATARGDLEDWEFVLQEVQAPSELAHLQPGREPPKLWALERQPQRPYDLRVTLWLQAEPPHWPLGVRWGVEPGGEPLTLWLTQRP